MNFVENNGKKVAAILCVASAFPVVATVVAAKEEPGWHGDRYVNEDKTVAKGWQEIEGKSYYFSENGTVDSTKTETATTASVSSSITGDVKETVATASQEAVQEENDAKAQEEAEAQAQASQEQASAVDTSATDTDADANKDATTTEDAADDQTAQNPFGDETNAGTQLDETTPQAPVQDTTTQPDVSETPSQDTTDNANTYVEQPQAPSQDASSEAQQPEALAQDTTTTTDQTNTDNSQDYTQPEAPAQDTTATPSQDVVETPAQDTTAQTSNLGQRISAAAQNLVGVTDGQWCTQVVQQALANAGVSDAYQLWPDQYVGQYGYYTSDPQEGDLIYYYNGGRGVDHIAIYIGNGEAVHGNYLGKTVIASAYVPGAGSPQFIRVVR